MPAVSAPPKTETSRHTLWVRITHWITFVAFIALLVTGAEIVISHPRFYWGETGNVNMQPLFSLHIPSSRDMVPTGYGYVMPDQNGWSRYLHFEAAWVLVFTGAVYFLVGLVSSHFRKNLLPSRSQWNGRAIRQTLLSHLRLAPSDPADTSSYNVMQRLTYLAVIFILFPLVILTGLALSPAFNSAVPAVVNLLGGRQSARTLHFFISAALLLFLIVHVAMVLLSGFRSRMRAITIGPAVKSAPETEFAPSLEAEERA